MAERESSNEKDIFVNDFYIISKDFKLISFNESVRKTYKNIKVGDFCYKATMNRDSPCLHCPIAKNSDNNSPIYWDPFYNAWIESIFSKISDNEYAVTCRPAKNSGARIFDDIGKEANEKLIKEVSGHAVNNQLLKMEKDYEELNDQIKNQLVRTKLRIETMAEAIHGGFKIGRNDKKFSFKYVSEQLASMLGYTVDEFLEASGGTMAGIVNMEDVVTELPKATEQIKKGELYVMNYRIRCKDGSWKYVEDKGRLIKNENSEDEFWSFIVDKDKLVKTEKALEEIRILNNQLKENQEKLENFACEQEEQIEEITALNEQLSENQIILEKKEKDLQENLDIIANAGYGIWRIFIKNNGKNEMYANKTLREILGAEDTNLTPAEFYTYFHNRIFNDFLDDIEDDFRLMMEGHSKSRVLNWTHPTKGKIFLSVGGKRYTLLDGTAVISGFCCDVTEQTNSKDVLNMNLKEALARSEEANAKLLVQKRITDALSKIYFATYFIDIDNDTFIELSAPEDITRKLTRKGCASRGFKFFISTGVKKDSQEMMFKFCNLSTLKERLMNNQSITFDYESIVRGWCRASWVVISRNENGEPLSLLYGISNVDEFIKADLDKNKRLKEMTETLEKYNKELYKAKDEAEAANKAKTSFLFNMSHDIRTPMNAILGFAQLLETEKNNPQVVEDYVKKIKNAGSYLLTIINNILDMARIESGNAVLDIGFLNLDNEDLSVVSVFDESIKSKNIDFSCSRNVKHRYLALDVTKVRQIWVNLISNALKYTQNGGKISLSIEEVPCEREGYATFEISISDNGIGMSKDFINHIFDPFAREKNTTESKIAGTGLGMAIVKKLVDLMNGTIEVKSELGKGTTFKVTMTHKIVENPEDYLSKRECEQIDNSSFIDKRILLAEDNELNAEIAIAILKNVGFKVEHVNDGVECLDKLMAVNDDYFDLILMDVQMPNLDGYSTTKKIRNLSNKISKIPIIAMTANAFEEDKKNAFNAGMNDHISKPIDVENLKRVLSKIFRE